MDTCFLQGVVVSVVVAVVVVVVDVVVVVVVVVVVIVDVLDDVLLVDNDDVVVVGQHGNGSGTQLRV